MASATGAWGGRNAGNNRGRLRIVTSQSPSSVGSGTSSVTLTIDVYLQSQYGVVWNGFTVKIAGALSWTGSANVNHGSSGGETRIARRTLTVSTQYASTVSRSFTASISGLTLFPTPPSVSVTHVVPARPISAPNAPSNVTATRQSDTRQNLAWTRNATTAAPYTNILVQRRVWGLDLVWGSWVTIATLGGTATSYADTSTRDNRSYQYRLRARNASGTSGASGSTSSVRTTPRPPADVVAKKLSGGDIRVEFRQVAPFTSDVEHQLQDNPGGSGWVTVATRSGSGSFTHVDPDPSVTHRYRVRTRETRSGLTSAWSSVSNTVQLLAPPNAPTRRGPTGVIDKTAPIRFEWRHNEVDTTDQTAVHIQTRVVGAGWQNVASSSGIDTSDEFYVRDPYGEVEVREWRVRTRGDHPDWSPWSSVGSFRLATRPTLAINAPEDGIHDTSSVELVVGYDQAEDVAQQRVEAELVTDGVVVESLTWTGTGDTRSFDTSLDDATEYTVRARARSGDGLWSDWDTVTFTTDFPSPVPFEVGAEWDRESGAVIVSGEALREPATGEMEAEFLTYQRRDHEDAPWVTLVADVEPGTTVVDPVPALGAPEYRVISHTSLPSSTTGPVLELPWVHGPHDPIFVNTGPGFELVGTARGDQASNEYAIEQSSFHAAGIELPIAIFGTAETGSVSFTGRIFDPRIGVEPVTTRDEWRALLRQRQVVCYRDCQGRKMFGLLGLSFSQQGPVETVQITVDEVWHEEGVVA